MIADKSTTNLTFFIFFHQSIQQMPSFRKANNCSCCLQDAWLLLDLGAWAFSSLTEQLCPESRAAGDPSLPGHPAVRYRPNNCTQSRQLPGLLAPASPNNYSFYGQDGSWAASRHRTIIRFPDPGRSDPNKKNPEPEARGLYFAR